jgi:chromosome segregation protein
MRLKQIKLAGFKSFVDPTTVTLPGNRCAVVGPNGCGKSNIIDAVRWVMGESSAKQLRGENLTDVIFNGSNSRKPTAAASIELIFDNSDGRIGGEYSSYADIAIRRQVTRDNQSQYFLNGNKCRRRDIQDIFLGTGFGPRSYSIIEQGMISQLVEAKPEELRVYLEEAAGISKYKERRRETENRIKHTRENLERINDIREELGRQLDRLQRQAQAAERYRELKKEEALLTAQLYVLRFSALKADLAQREARIGELEVELEKAVAEQRRLEAGIERERQIHSETSDRFNKIQGQYYQLGADIARIEEAIQFNQERVKQLELDLTSVEQRSTETQQQLEMDEAQIARFKEEINTLLPEVDNLAAQDAEAHERLNDCETRLREWQARWDRFNAQAAQNDSEADVQTSRIEHLEQLLARLKRRAEELESLQQQQPSQSGAANVDRLAAEISELETNARLFDAKIDECLKELAAAREDVLVRERVLEDARNEVQNLRHELASLQALQDAALGENVQEANAWLADHALADATRLGETLSVVPGWERALEAVLGRFIQALQVDDLDAFADSLADLADGDLALVEARPLLPSAQSENNLELPSLGSLVRSDGISAGSLLHGVFAAQSAQVALAKRDRLEAGQSIITREGFWVGADWVRVLHDHDQEAGIIARGQTLETLNLRVEEAERTLGELQNHVQEGRARVERLEVERESLQKQYNELTANLSKRRTDHGVTQVKIEEADARREQLAKEQADIADQVTLESERLKEARGKLLVAEQSRARQGGRRVELAQSRERLERELNEARETARGARDRYHALNVQKESVQSRLAASVTAKDRLLAQEQALKSQLETINAGIETSALPLPQLQRELEKKLEDRVAVEGELSEARAKLENTDQSIRKLEAERHQCEDRVGGVRGKLESMRVERQGLAVQEDNLKEQIAGTGHDLSATQKNLPEDADEDAWVEALERMDRRIQRLGAINLAAIDEYEKESERKVYLDAQAEDLDQAMETLLEAIKKIDRETRSRFKETFEAVNQRLGELFPKVFGGGHAYLELTGEDLLDTGVSLMARPPGKRNASVHLLSGGEKAMTAVALIFAIFHLNPSPVCLLDEVDAPLDDMNVSRFASLIEEMSADVQFLVITHNKITMEMADYLMGVTMHEPGVSRLVSVDVEEAAAMAVV